MKSSSWENNWVWNTDTVTVIISSLYSSKSVLLLYNFLEINCRREREREWKLAENPFWIIANDEGDSFSVENGTKNTYLVFFALTFWLRNLLKLAQKPHYCKEQIIEIALIKNSVFFRQL